MRLLGAAIPFSDKCLERQAQNEKRLVSALEPVPLVLRLLPASSRTGHPSRSASVPAPR